ATQDAERRGHRWQQREDDRDMRDGRLLQRERYQDRRRNDDAERRSDQPREVGTLRAAAAQEDQCDAGEQRGNGGAPERDEPRAQIAKGELRRRKRPREQQDADAAEHEARERRALGRDSPRTSNATR